MLPKTAYQHGFQTEIQSDKFLPGLTEDTVRTISALRKEPEWLLDFRLQAYQTWLTMTEPKWSELSYSIDYQALSYFSTPRKKASSLAEIDPEILATYEKLGIPLAEQERLSGVAVDAIFDSSSIFTSYREDLEKQGILFCSFSEAVQKYPDLVRQYLGTAVPSNDNFFACLNAAVFSDGTFVFIPRGVKCTTDLTSYFRLNTENLGQFERTLIIAEDDTSVSYLEGCSAPQFLTTQLHAAVVEIIAHDHSRVRYSTVQNWYPGDKNGVGGVYNFVTKRALCQGLDSRVSWTQFETGASVTWKYPSCILRGDNSVGEFFSLAVTNNFQQADTGTKMIHIGKNTKSRIISKSIAAGKSRNIFRSLVKILPSAEGARNYSSCDSLLFGDSTHTNTYPTLDVRNNSSTTEHEAKSGSIDRAIIEYLGSRGLTEEQANNLVVAGYAREVLQHLPLEFALEAQALLKISFAGSVG